MVEKNIYIMYTVKSLLSCLFPVHPPSDSPQLLLLVSSHLPTPQMEIYKQVQIYFIIVLFLF